MKHSYNKSSKSSNQNWALELSVSQENMNKDFPEDVQTSQGIETGGVTSGKSYDSYRVKSEFLGNNLDNFVTNSRVQKSFESSFAEFLQKSRMDTESKDCKNALSNDSGRNCNRNKGEEISKDSEYDDDIVQDSTVTSDRLVNLGESSQVLDNDGNENMTNGSENDTTKHADNTELSETSDEMEDEVERLQIANKESGQTEPFMKDTLKETADADPCFAAFSMPNDGGDENDGGSEDSKLQIDETRLENNCEECEDQE